MAKDLNGKQTGMSPVNPVNDNRVKVPKGYNQFPQSYEFLNTERYGQYSPFFYMKCEAGDKVPLRSSHDLHTYTLRSPLIGNVSKTKSYIQVPMYAIYPRTWIKQFTIPTHGSDIPADCRALLDVSRLVDSLVELLQEPTVIIDDYWIYSMLLMEALLSNGSLLSAFNIHLCSKVMYNNEEMSFDAFFDRFIAPKIFEVANSIHFVDSNDIYYVLDDYDGDGNFTRISRHRLLEMLRNQDLSLVDEGESIQAGFSGFEIVEMYSSYPASSLDPTFNYLNIEPIIAYQLAIAQFGTNDHVDFIYSADLYRDNMQSLFSYVNGNYLPAFTYNGVRYQYDVFSTHYFNLLLDRFTELNAVRFFLNLFSFQNSLRYGDYFLGAKPEPLAVGDISAPVYNSEVSAIDITRSIQMQRLMNRVNIVGSKIGNFISGILGVSVPEAPKDVPVFISHESFNVDGFETNNTSDAQLDPDVDVTITSHLRSKQSNFAFEVSINEPCYIIGVSTYFMKRVYSRTIDRFAFHHDRYDDFIPDMQYIGDQEIFSAELDGAKGSKLIPFAYTLRYMEYKQRYSYASGGFIERLPSWSFITDNNDGNPFTTGGIDPSYIRSSSSEFDRFYKSLSGYSLGNYFHFIVAYTNDCSPLRKMEFTPQILK